MSLSGENHISSEALVEELTAIFALDSIRHFGPQKFKAIHNAGLTPLQVIRRPDLLPVKGKRGEAFKQELVKYADTNPAIFRDRAEKQIRRAQEVNGHVLTYSHPDYPCNVFASNYPAPVLYVRGSPSALNVRPLISCVGSRAIRKPYDRLLHHFAVTAANHGFGIVSGFALGADTIGHRAAIETSEGSTICVMPGGLDRPFPPENKRLWLEFLDSSRATFVSEYHFGTGASKLTLRKRNKLIVAFSLGVLIGQSARAGGAMNAYRFALEQKKPVGTFRSDGASDASGNQHIAEKSPDGSVVFDNIAPDPHKYESWLHTLSSST